MPNHVATIFRAEGNEEQIEKFIQAITLSEKERKSRGKRGDDVEVNYDFGKLLPCPKELSAVSSPVHIVSEEEYKEAVVKRKAALKNNPKAHLVSGLPLTQALSNKYKKEFGADNWYDWMNEFFGTKWGMYDVVLQERGTGVVEFFYMTAWSPATPYFVTISKQFPDVEFYHEFADEGGGFVGFERIQDGKIVGEGNYDWSSDEGISIRENVGYYHPEDEEEEAAG